MNEPVNRNFWRGQTIRLRAVEQKDLDEFLTSLEEPDTEINRYEDAIGFPRSPEAERESLQKLAKRVGKNDFLYCLIEGRLRNMYYTNGEYFDELYFGVTSAEWEQLDPPLSLQRFEARAEAAS